MNTGSSNKGVLIMLLQVPFFLRNGKANPVYFDKNFNFSNKFLSRKIFFMRDYCSSLNWIIELENSLSLHKK